MNDKLRGLYAITDARETDPQRLLRDVEQALLGGARILQYRDKSRDPQQRLQTAQRLRELTRQYEAIFIINDDPQLAKATQADGVHLGHQDTPIEAARDLLGTDSIIGISCYNHLSQARQATAAGADYVAFGRFFPSQTKPQAETASIEILQQAQQEIAIPIAAIGGITSDNAGPLIEAGAQMLAVVNDLFAQTDIRAAAQRYQAFFSKT